MWVDYCIILNWGKLLLVINDSHSIFIYPRKFLLIQHHLAIGEFWHGHLAWEIFRIRGKIKGATHSIGWPRPLIIKMRVLLCSSTPLPKPLWDWVVVSRAEWGYYTGVGTTGVVGAAAPAKEGWGPLKSMCLVITQYCNNWTFLDSIIVRLDWRESL